MKEKQIINYSLAGLVVLATVLIYLSCLQNDFILWDDDIYVYENSFIRSFTGDFFRWAFFDFYASNWHPLTWISHAMDYAVWGLNPLGHHLTNIILHALNTFLVVLLVVRLREERFRMQDSRSAPDSSLLTPHNSQYTLIAASITGLLFGLHPLHVESVAWVAERKDLLCALFFLLSIMMYMSYVSYKTYKAYVLSLVFFIFALMSKPMAVTLPAVLLLLDWYPFERFRSFKGSRTIFAEKLPFIALSLASAALTVLAQRAGGALKSMEFAPLSTRVLVGFEAIIVYLRKVLWPIDLVPYYPYPKGASLFSIEYLLAIILVLGTTLACAVMVKRQKLWLSAWGYYVVTLLPVLGIVQVGTQSMADRYTYIPSLGPFLLLGLSAAWVWARVQRMGERGLIVRVCLLVVSLCVVVSLSYLTFRQTGIWRNSIVFWSYVIEKEPERASFAYYNRGMAFGKMELPDRAIADFDKAIALNPAYYEAYNNRGLTFEQMGLFDKAIKDLEVSLMTVKSSSPEAHNNLGKLYRKTGQFDKAVESYDRAIVLNPNYYEAHYNRAIVFEKMGNQGKAIEDYNKAVSLNPSYYEAYNNLGVLFGNAAEYDRAIEYLTKAISIDPSKTGAYVNRGVLHERRGSRGPAVADFQKACDLGSGDGCGALDALLRRKQ